jgi:hypothetical protein
LVVFVAVLSVGATGVAPAAGGGRAFGERPAGDGSEIDIEVFGLDVLSIDVASASGAAASNDCRGQSRCEQINVVLRSGPCDGRSCRTITYDVKPVYDGWEQCVRGDANTPGAVQAPPGGGSVQLRVTVVGGVFAACGYKESRMRWLITGQPGFGAQGYVELRKSPGGATRPACGAAVVQPWNCRADHVQPNAIRAGWTNGPH